jgi:phospholipid transport system substrate-binding protein
MARNYLTRFLPFLVTAFLATGLARAQAVAPDVLVKNVTEEVMTILREDKEIQSGNIQRAMTLIETKVAPHFDFSRMTSLAVGRGWQQISADQRKALTEEFHTLLVRTYANSLTAYSEQSVSFKPSATPDKNGEVTVRSQINKPGAAPIPLDYSLIRNEDGWKVFDVMVANVSLVTNYRSSFASEMNKGGADGLLKALQEKNRRSEAAAPSAA